MTAIISVLQRNKVSIITDSAGYTLAGEVMIFYDKCLPIEGLKAAVACRGSSLAPGIFSAELADMFDSFDDILADGGAAVRAIYDDYEDRFLECGEPNVDLFLAGWSERENAPVHRFLSSATGHGVATWRWHEINAAMVAPMPSLPAMTRAGCRPVADAEGFDVIVDGIRTMTAQRYTKGHSNSAGTGELVHMVGGRVFLTEVTSTGVTQRHIHDFGDQVGDFIQPFPQIVTAPVAGMSRQQRRAAEREAGKAAA